MKEVIRFFELKNDYLEKFLSLTRVFISKLENGHNVNIELLKNNRQNILAIIDHIDKKIVELIGKDLDNSIVTNIIPEIGNLVFTKDTLVKEIVISDAKLFNLLDYQKDNVKYEINKLKDISEAISNYNSDDNGELGQNINIEK